MMSRFLERKREANFSCLRIWPGPAAASSAVNSGVKVKSRDSPFSLPTSTIEHYTGLAWAWHLAVLRYKFRIPELNFYLRLFQFPHHLSALPERASEVAIHAPGAD